MTVYDDIYGLRHSSNLKQRVCVALAKAAQDIFAEDSGTTNHANRIVWAKAVLTTDGAGEADRFMWAVLTDATVRANGISSTDAQIQSAVDNVIDLFAV